jgi:uncharacterized protein YfdQ (DUF2303 family)
MSLDQTKSGLEFKAQLSSVMETTAVLTSLASAAAQSITVEGVTYAVVPKDYKLEDLTSKIEAQQPTPLRKKGTVQLRDLTSLITYCKDQCTPASGYIYADTDTRSITAVFNDQKAAEPGWKDHRAHYKAEYTPEFSKWLKFNGHPFGQTEFAEFIEDNFIDLHGEYASMLLEVATTLQAKTDINFSSAKRLQNGQAQLSYTETIDARAGVNGALEIPKEFTLGLRIFKNGDGYKIKARLKYRLHSGGVKFYYELDRPERSVEDAFNGYITKLQEQSGYTVLLGSVN